MKYKLERWSGFWMTSWSDANGYHVTAWPNWWSAFKAWLKWNLRAAD